MSDLMRLSLSIEPPLFEQLEERVAGSAHANRSEYIRDLIRERLAQEAWEGDEEALGTITLVYDHHQRDLCARLTDLQHDASCHVLATTHVHLDHHRCAEMIMVTGRARCIKDLADAMRQIRGVHHAALSVGLGTTDNKAPSRKKAHRHGRK